jgi:P27 family predicted phage terminase small subunit
MGTRGPKSVPTALTVVPDKRRAREPKPRAGTIKPPTGLSRGALEVWRRKAPDMIAKGVLTTWDVDAFAEYCEAVEFARAARLKLVKEGTTIVGARGGAPVKNPAFQIWRDALATELQLGTRFGMTPSDRPGIPAGGAGGHTSSGKERFFTA